ncbi:MAG: hypothetical protein KBS55_01000 [Bacteroidales bacterium]|nr:hypothetical protein [Candidatus Cryptobacteroides aphodequi]
MNTNFAKELKQDWNKYQVSEGKPRANSPDPQILPIADATQNVSNKSLPVSETIEVMPDKWPTNMDAETAAGIYQGNLETISFMFYGSKQEVKVPAGYGRLHPSGISEKDVSVYWSALSDSNYSIIVNAIKAAKSQIHLNDWGEYEWVKGLSECLFPQNQNSEQQLFTVFIMNQMGLMFKVARIDDRLTCLFASKQPVYFRKYVIIDTYIFYFAEPIRRVQDVYTYNCTLSTKVAPLDLRIKSPMCLGGSDVIRVDQNASSLNAVLSVPINRQMMRFYNTYPQTSIEVYASSMPDVSFSDELLQTVRTKLTSQSTLEQINSLLKYVQVDFPYKTDIEQFGVEKPFFLEENYYYKFNDCEDRAVLFTYLVRNVTGLDAVLLDYGDHISTAVRLPEDIKGAYVSIKDSKFYVCDPSYIGSTIGMSIPKYLNHPVKVYSL